MRDARHSVWRLAAGILCALLLHSPLHASLKAPEQGRLSPTSGDDYLERSHALYGRIVPGAVPATKTHEESRPAYRKAAPPQAPVVRPPMTVSGAGPGQAGYLHYFLLGKPDGGAEMQVGIELADRTIAWSFPDLGVAVSPFIESGTVEVRGRVHQVTHLFGIRPFPDDAAMAELVRELPARVIPWIDHGVHHCDADPPPRGVCVSCLGFVLRILFPGHFPLQADLPDEMKQARAGHAYTTEDLLLYLTGLHRLATREARLERIGELALPAPMREELVRVVTAEAVVETPAPAIRSPRAPRAERRARPSRPAARRL
jgi:hypothetical protein